MMFFPMFYTLPMLSAVFLFIEVPPLDRTFYIYFSLCLPVNAIGFYLYNLAIRISPLSLTVPYLSFTPMFIIGTGYLFLNETLSAYGIMGIIVTCIGGYILNIDPSRTGIVEPFKAIFHEKGSWIMIIASFIFSFTAVLGKAAILHSSPLFFTISFFFCMNFLLILCFLLTGKIKLATFTRMPVKGLLTGFLFFGHVICHGYAVCLTQAAYMVSVKRLSILFGIIYGMIIFKEKNIAIRFSGATLMLTGAVFIILKG